MRRLVFLILVMSTMTYLIVGSVVFHYLEDYSETQQKKSLARAHAEFMEHHPGVNRTELEQLIKTAIRTHMEGISIAAILERNLTANASLDDDSVVTSSKWDIASGFLFCITVISTIGYGNMVPRTWGGQLFCIFYALFGIPIFGAVLVGTGERLQIPIKKLHKCRPWVKDNAIKDQKLKSILLLSTGMSVIVFIPAWVFTITEDWSYLEGMYYSIITLTTVGFGDLVPESIFMETGQGLEEFLIPKGATATRHYFYRIVLSVWIIMGLSWIALILSEISTMMQSQMNNVADSTSHRLSNLEVLVRKKAKETRERFSKRDKGVPGQTNNVMVLSIAATSQGSEDEGEADLSEDTNIVTSDDPGGGSTNNGSNSDASFWTNMNGNNPMLDEYSGHALPNTDELTTVVGT